MKLLYIGSNIPGGTSGMRAKALQELLKPTIFKLIDTGIPFQNTDRLFRSVGFRYKFGPFISNINVFILENLPAQEFDLIWVDKASFILPSTTKILRRKAKHLVHYTPDTAFYQNRSGLFEKSMLYYDRFITTKSFDLNRYPANKTILTHQGFDLQIHKPYFSFEEKTREVVFIGLYEPSRGKVIRLLLESGIRVTLAGKNWKKFNYLNHPLIEYLGEGIFGEKYARVISSGLFGLGLISKTFPELHTTRTIEIPACGTALITEKNYETSQFYNETDVIFYSSFEEIPTLITKNKSDLNVLKTMSQKTHLKILAGGYDTHSILKNIINQL